MIDKDIEIATAIESVIKDNEQIELKTYHTIHAGVYTRTVVLEEGQAISGTLIKIPTTLLVTGNVNIFIGSNVINVCGFEAIVADGNRKQIMYAIDRTSISMVFKTNAKTIEEAEEEFTSDYDSLMSRDSKSINILNMKEI